MPPQTRRSTGGLDARVAAWLKAEPGELAPLAWSFGYFFCLLCGYYILRPLRDEMGIQGGVDNLQWVFTATFVTMLLAVPLFGWAAARLPRRRLVLATHGFFAANLAVFFVLFRLNVEPAWVARAFFVWVSVFNLVAVSVFWSVMADVFSNAQARRLFGVIAAGGSAGAIVGPGLTALLSERIGLANLLPLSMLLLLAAAGCGVAVMHGSARGRQHSVDEKSEAPLRGGALAGAVRVVRSPYLLGLCLFIVLYTSLSTFLYFEQAHIVAAAFSDAVRRTQVFALMDLVVNVLTVGAQIFVTARLVKWLGLPLTLALIPVLMAVGFVVLGLAPTLMVLVVFQVLRRAGNYAVARPAREMLFTVLPRQDKYKSKNFIDTVVYRGGDALSGWAFAGLSGLGLGLSAIAFAAVPLAGLWMATGMLLGLSQERKRQPDAVQGEARK